MAFSGVHGYGEPPVDRRIPVSVGGHVRTIGADVLSRYLPNIWLHIGRTSNFLDVEQAARESDLVGSKQVPMQAMIRTWIAVLKTLARTGEPEKVNATLSALLEQTFRKERRHPSLRDPSLFMYTLHLFECLADISFDYTSRCLAKILHEFYVKHGEHVAKEDTREAMLRWGVAIVSSNMNEQERLGCLRQIVNTRPEWRSHGNHALRHYSNAVNTFMFALGRLSRYMEADKEYMVERGRGGMTRFDGRRYGYSRPVRTPLRPYDTERNPFDVVGPLHPDLNWTPRCRMVRGAFNVAFDRQLLARDWFNRHGRSNHYDGVTEDSEYWDDPYDPDDFDSDYDLSFR